jgi:hypothetical protein
MPSVYFVLCLSNFEVGSVTAELVFSRLCEFLEHIKSIGQISISWFSLSSEFMDNKLEFQSKQRRRSLDREVMQTA